MRRCFAFLLALCCGLPGTAQQVETVRVPPARKGPYLRFDPFTVQNEAFKQAYTKCLELHDSRGYLWFISEPNAGEQLIRYDGTYYRSFGSEWGGQLSDLLGTVRENEAHEIWATSQRGLAWFDPLTETFRTFRNPFVKQQAVSHWVMGKRGENWFTSNAPPPPKNVPVQPFFKFDSRARRFYRIRPARLIDGYSGRVEAETAQVFVPRATDAAGQVWGDTYGSSGQHTLSYYDAARNAVVWYPLSGFVAPEFDKSGGPGQKLDFINAVVPDGRYVWLGGWSRVGLLRLDTQTGRWKQFQFRELVHNRIFKIVPRNDRQFWLHTDDALVLFDKTTETLHTYPHEPDNPFTPVAEAKLNQAGQNRSMWMSLANHPNLATLSVLHESKQPFRIKDDTLLRYSGVFRAFYKKDRRLYFTYNTDQHAHFAEYDEGTKTVHTRCRLPLNGFVEQ